MKCIQRQFQLWLILFPNSFHCLSLAHIYIHIYISVSLGVLLLLSGTLKIVLVTGIFYFKKTTAGAIASASGLTAL